jgi:glycylpeptide N-tetradecanoyltransferase
MSDNVFEEGCIQENKPASEIRQTPYTMPNGFEWCSLDIMDDVEANEMYTLLNQNYVEDDDNMFRFDYSINFLKWALTPPGYNTDLHVGVRSVTTKKLMAMITGVQTSVGVNAATVPMVEINFLCIHKKLRAKRLAPVLIKEVTRRVNLTGVFQAVYTAGRTLPKPITSARYWHRSLNPKKLIECRFSSLNPRMTMARTVKLYKLPSTPQTPGLRVMEEKDVVGVHKLLSTYLSK